MKINRESVRQFFLRVKKISWWGRGPGISDSELDRLIFKPSNEDTRPCVQQNAVTTSTLFTSMGYPLADNVRPGSVVITRNALDIGLVKSVSDGHPTEVYARKSGYDGERPGQYGGINSVQWYDTGIYMTLDEWILLSHQTNDAAGFHNYWRDRLL